MTVASRSRREGPLDCGRLLGTSAGRVVAAGLAALAFAVFIACGGSSGNGSDLVAPDGYFPPAGATDVFLRGPVIVFFNRPVSEAEITVTWGDENNLVSGTTTVHPSGLYARWEATGSMDPEQSYDVVYRATPRDDGSSVEGEWSFETGPETTAPEDPFVLDGRVFRLDLLRGRIVASPGAVAFLRPILANTALIRTQVDGATEEVSGSFGWETVDAGGQDFCRPMRPVEIRLSNGDEVTFDGLDETYVTDGENTTRVLGADWWGVTDSTGSRLRGGRLRGLLDVMPLEPLLDPPEYPCDYLQREAGTPCQPCPGGVAECVPFEIVGLEAEAEPDYPIVIVEPDQTENHRCGNCGDGRDNDLDGSADDDPECVVDGWP